MRLQGRLQLLQQQRRFLFGADRFAAPALRRSECCVRRFVPQSLVHVSRELVYTVVMATAALAAALIVVAAAAGGVAADASFVVDPSALSRRFDGIGGLSGGGATSRLLVSCRFAARRRRRRWR